MTILELVLLIASIASGLHALHAIFAYWKGWASGRHEAYFGLLYRRAFSKEYGTLLLLLFIGAAIVTFNFLPGRSKIYGEAFVATLFVNILVIHCLAWIHNAYHRPLR